MACLQEMQLNVKVPKDMMKIIMDVQKLTKLRVRDSKIEEVLTLGLEEMWLEDLSELNHIYKGPKYTLRLQYLRHVSKAAVIDNRRSV